MEGASTPFGQSRGSGAIPQLTSTTPSFFQAAQQPSTASTPSALTQHGRTETPSFFDTTHATPKPKNSALRVSTPGVFNSGTTQPLGTPMEQSLHRDGLDMEPRSGLRGNELGLHAGLAGNGLGGGGMRKRVLTKSAAAAGASPFVNDENRQMQVKASGDGHIGIGAMEDSPIPGNSLLDMSTAPKLVEEVGPSSQASKQQTGIGLDLGVARGLGVSSPALHGMPQLQQQKNQWVTVFGYPMGAGAEVLRHFQACGEVHQHRSEPGNWMHLLYASPVQASRALAQNGQYIKIGGSVVMIGVKPCSEFDLGNVKTAPASISSRNLHHKQLANKHRVDRPQQLRHAPNKAASMCKRFWKWVLDW